MLLTVTEHIQMIVSHIEDSLGAIINPISWKDVQKLPLFLQELYQFYTFEIGRNSYLLCICTVDENNTAGEIVKHFRLLSKYWEHSIIYSAQTVSSLERSRLVKARIPFIIPKKQLYLPFIGIDFKEIFPAPKKNVDRLSPMAQVLILGKLYNATWIDESPSQISDILNITKMSIGRAFTEIVNHGFAEINQKGRVKRLHFLEKGQILWEKVSPLLKSPVSSKIKAAFKPEGLEAYQAGLSGLSHYSMLQNPGHQTIAIWNRLTIPDDKRLSKEEITDEYLTIEKWSYNPGIFAKQGVADPLSMYLSLRDSTDERVEMALDELMEAIKW